jgi:hypothetical protein
VIEVALTEIVGIEMGIGLVELAEEEEAEEALEKVEDLIYHTMAAQTKGAIQMLLVVTGRWQRGWALVYEFSSSSTGSLSRDLFSFSNVAFLLLVYYDNYTLHMLFVALVFHVSRRWVLTDIQSLSASQCILIYQLIRCISQTLSLDFVLYLGFVR